MIEFNDLPDGWILTKLPDLICHDGILADGDWIESKDQDPNGQIRLIQLADIGDAKYINKSVRFLTHIKASELNCTFIKKGDILIARMPDPLGRACIFPGDKKDSVTVVDVCIFRSGENGINHHLLMHFLNSPSSREIIKQLASGTTRKRISKKNLSDIAFPLPPLNEQRRIVSTIEQLTDRSHKARAALEDVPKLIEQFRQSVLAAAFRGDLTADWREKNPDIEPASELLERIKIDRRKRWEEACRISKQNGSRQPKSDKKDSEDIEIKDLEIIPATWCWEKLVNIADLVGGVTKGRNFKGRTTIHVIYLRVANVQDGFLDLEEIKEIEVLPEDVEKYRLDYGDILFTEGGDRDKLGRGTIWRNEIEGCIHQNHVYRARLYSSEILPEYISLATKTEYSKDYFFNNASQTVNLASINMTTLGKLPIAIPPIAEQKAICDKVNQAFKILDSLRSSYQVTVEEINQLDRSILAKAFRGELVPQDPNDEPAAVLLERIRAECEQTSTPKQRGKTTRKNSSKQLSIDLE